MRSLKLCLILLLSIELHAKSQVPEVTVNSGDLSFLKGQTTLNVQFVYDGMLVSQFSEPIFLKQKKSEYRKTADYEKFMSDWEADRAGKYEPKFLKQLNLTLFRADIKADMGLGDAKYIMIVKTAKTEPGFYHGSSGMKRDTYINLVVNFVETADTNHVLCTVKANYIVGETDNLAEMKETNTRITYAYGAAADKISKIIYKECTKKEKVVKEVKPEIKNDDKSVKDKEDKPVKDKKEKEKKKKKDKDDDE